MSPCLFAVAFRMEEEFDSAPGSHFLSRLHLTSCPCLITATDGVAFPGPFPVSLRGGLWRSDIFL